MCEEKRPDLKATRYGEYAGRVCRLASPFFFFVYFLSFPRFHFFRLESMSQGGKRHGKFRSKYKYADQCIGLGSRSFKIEQLHFIFC